MFTYPRSLQRPIVSQSWHLAALVAIASGAVGYVDPVAAQSLHDRTVQLAQASSHDAYRCQQLYGIWQRYKANSTNGSGRDVQSQAALQDCRGGRFEAGIALLEQLLRNDQIPVPPDTAAASR